jgi:hypothetical protein
VGESLGGVVVRAIDVFVFLWDEFSMQCVRVRRLTIRLLGRCTAS